MSWLIDSNSERLIADRQNSTAKLQTTNFRDGLRDACVVPVAEKPANFFALHFGYHEKNLYIYQQQLFLMSRECLTGCGLFIAGISAIAYFVLVIFILPIKAQCEFNNVIPPDAVINLSMQDWIYGGMGCAAGIVAVMGSCARSKSNNDCLLVMLALAIFLYFLFVFGWSIVGLLIYINYYSDACQNDNSYSILMKLGIYLGLALSSPSVLTILGLIISVCKQTCCLPGYRQPLLEERPAQVVDSRLRASQIVVAHKEANNFYQPKVVAKREEAVVTDAEYQQKRSIYENLLNRLSRKNSRPMSQRLY